MKKYLLFAGSTHRTYGGMGDFIDSFDTIKEAMDYVGNTYEWFQVVEYETMKIVQQNS